MKIKIFAFTLFIIGAFIACKKVTETTNPKYSDAELNIDSKSAFADEERKIKEGVMDYKDINISDRKFITENLIMENKHPKEIIDGMKVFNKLSIQQQIGILKVLLPSSNITIYDNLKKSVIYEYKYIPTNGTSFLGPQRCWTTVYSTSQQYGCPGSGEVICFKYNPNC